MHHLPPPPQIIQRKTHTFRSTPQLHNIHQYPVPGKKNASRHCKWRNLTLKWNTQYFRPASDFSFQLQLDLMQSQPKNMAEHYATCTHPCRNVSKKHTFRMSSGNKNMSRHCIERVMYEDFPNTNPTCSKQTPDISKTWRRKRPLNVQRNQSVMKCQVSWNSRIHIWLKSRTRIMMILQYRVRTLFVPVLNLQQ